MKLARFQRLTEAYGADPARWPAAERAQAEALSARSAEAASALEAARALDRQLDRAAPAIGDDAVDRVWEAIRRRTMTTTPAVPTPWAWARPHLPAAAFLTAMLALGLIVGAAPRGDASLGGVVAYGTFPQSYVVAWSE